MFVLFQAIKICELCIEMSLSWWHMTHMVLIVYIETLSIWKGNVLILLLKTATSRHRQQRNYKHKICPISAQMKASRNKWNEYEIQSSKFLWNVFLWYFHEYEREVWAPLRPSFNIRWHLFCFLSFSRSSFVAFWNTNK